MKNLGQINDPKDIVTKDYVDAQIGNYVPTKAASADKLTNKKNISVSGAVKSTPQQFDGTQNVIVPISELDETYLKWGTKSVAGDIGVIDASFLDEAAGNRFAYMPADDIDVEYSRDGGTTWLSYGTSDNNKMALTTTSSWYTVGNVGLDSYTSDTNCQLRVTLTANSVYSKLKKLLLYINSQGSRDCWCIIEQATFGDETTFSTLTEKTGISGWSGWNSIPCAVTFGGSSTQTAQTRKLRITIGYDTASTSSTNKLTLIKMRAIGPTNWNNLNPLQNYNHAYTYNLDKSVKFMGDIIDSSNNKMSDLAARIEQLEAQLADVETQLAEI